MEKEPQIEDENEENIDKQLGVILSSYKDFEDRIKASKWELTSPQLHEKLEQEFIQNQFFMKDGLYGMQENDIRTIVEQVCDNIHNILEKQAKLTKALEKEADEAKEIISSLMYKDIPDNINIVKKSYPGLGNITCTREQKWSVELSNEEKMNIIDTYLAMGKYSLLDLNEEAYIQESLKAKETSGHHLCGVKETISEPKVKIGLSRKKG